MQIVIELYNGDFREVQKDAYSGTPFENRVFSAIANGTVLPEHGRLIDADEVLKDIDDLRKSPWYNDKRGNGFEYLIHEAVDMVQDLCILDAPTILEPSVTKG